MLAKNVSAKVAASQREYFPTSQKFPWKIFCFVKSSVNGLTFYYYFLMILHKIVTETPIIDINDVESRFSAIDDNFVEQYLDNILMMMSLIFFANEP